MKPTDEAARWLDQAANDLDFARYARDGGYHHQACFISQQGSEKALKALHYHRGARRVIGHSVVQLALADDEIASRFEDLGDGLRELDLFYIPTRYPNGLPGGAPYQAFSEGQARRAVQTAEAVLARVNEMMGVS
jgi:HEPN domain-containing protein